MIYEVKKMYKELSEDSFFELVPLDKLLEYSFQLVIAQAMKDSLHGIETSVDNV